MRFFKVFSVIVAIFLIVLTIIFATIYKARVAVINYFAQSQFKAMQVKITCLELNLASNMDIVVDKLCLQTPKADIDITNMTVKWQYATEPKISNIDINSLKITGTAPLLPPSNYDSATNQQSLKQQLMTSLRPITVQISQFNLPFKLNMRNIEYLPYSPINLQQSSKSKFKSQPEYRYLGVLSAIDNEINFSLKNADNIKVINAELKHIKHENDFKLTVTSQLKALKKFIMLHQLPISDNVKQLIDAHEISAAIKSTISFQNNSLSMHNTFRNLAVNSLQSVDESSVFSLTGMMNFYGQLNFSNKEPEELTLHFTNQNEVWLHYKKASLLNSLKKYKVPPKVISIIKDNPITTVNISLKNNATLTLSEQQQTIAFLAKQLEINAANKQREHQLTLNNLAFTLPYSKDNYQQNSTSDYQHSKSYTLAVNNFSIHSQLDLSSWPEVAKFTRKPMNFNLQGSLNKTAKQTKISFNHNSFITATDIIAQNNSEKLLSIKTLTAQLKGSVEQLENSKLKANLTVQNIASQVNLDKRVQLGAFHVASQINGELDNIHINATALADNVKLGSIVITGNVLSPKIQIAANKLPLTELLSLKIALPVKLAITDGSLDYSFSGQVTDLNNIDDTPFRLSVALTSVSGKVNGIGIQQLNWQQKFSLNGKKIATLPDSTHNLFIKLIETPTAISNLTMNTNARFDNTLVLNATNINGKLLGGSFTIPSLAWPFQGNRLVKVQLKRIDLAQLVALNNHEGIVVTGNISGEIPVTYDGEKYTIEQGELHNVNKGVIQVINNAAVDNLKANNSQLNLAFSALQNLHYHHLSSDVTLADNGYMLLQTAIKGYNPDIDNEVNLNLNLSYDLPGLLESLMITEDFENRIIKDLQ